MKLSKSNEAKPNFGLQLVLLFLGNSVGVLCWMGALCWMSALSRGEIPALLLAKGLLLSFFIAVCMALGHLRQWSFPRRLLLLFAVLGSGIIIGTPVLLVGMVLIMFFFLIKEILKNRPALMVSDLLLLVFGAFLLSPLSLRGMTYVNFMINNGLLSARINTDVLYHASWAAMLKENFLSSTGLHGLPVFPNHFLSNFLYGSISCWLGESVLESYGTLTALVFIPLLFYALLSAAQCISPAPTRRVFNLRVALLVLCFVGFLGFRRGGLMYRFAHWDSYLVSESYIISLLLLSGFAATFFRRSGSYPVLKGLLWLLLLFCAKISVGAVAFSMLTVQVFCAEKEPWLQKFFKIGIFAVMALYYIKFFSTTVHTGPAVRGNFLDCFILENFSLPNSFPPWVYLALVPVFHFFFPCLALAVTGVTFFNLKKREFCQLKDFLIISATIAVGYFSFLARAMWSGEYYFSNVSMFAALIFLLSYLKLPEEQTEPGRFRNPLRIVYALIFAGGILGGIFNTPFYLLECLKDGRTARRYQPCTVFAPYVKSLQMIRADKSTRGYCIYIAKDQHHFWELFPTHAPLMVPSLSERPALYGLPATNIFDQRFSLHYPQSLVREGEMLRFSREFLLAKTKKLGFAGYIDVRSNAVERVAVKP